MAKAATATTSLPPAPGAMPADPTNTTPPAVAATEKPRAVVTAIRSDIAIPIGAKRGSKGIYDFDTLEIGHSFCVVGRAAASMASTVNGVNRRYEDAPKRDATGAVIPKMIEMKDAAGNVVASVPEKDNAGNVVPAGFVASRKFAVFNVYAAGDASLKAGVAPDPDAKVGTVNCRVFRIPL